MKCIKFKRNSRKNSLHTIFQICDLHFGVIRRVHIFSGSITRFILLGVYVNLTQLPTKVEHMVNKMEYRICFKTCITFLKLSFKKCIKMSFTFFFPPITGTILDLYLENATVIWFRAVEFFNVSCRTFIWSQHFVQIPVMSWACVLDDNYLFLKSVCDLFCYEFPGEDLDVVMLLSVFPVYKSNKTLLVQVAFCCQIWHASTAALIVGK